MLHRSTLSRVAALGLIAIGLASGAAQAAIITYSGNFSNHNEALSSTTGHPLIGGVSADSYVSLSAFDSSLGTLTDVAITFTSAWSHIATVSDLDNSEEYEVRRTPYSCGWATCYYYYRVYYNDAWASATATATMTVLLYDHASASSTLSSALDLSCNRNLPYSGGAGSASCDDTESAEGYFNGALNLSSIALTEFIATPTDSDINLRFRNSQHIAGYCDDDDVGDHCDAHTGGDWRGTVTVAYTYLERVSMLERASVPEPGALALLGGGLLGLAFARRRRAR